MFNRLLPFSGGVVVAVAMVAVAMVVVVDIVPPEGMNECMHERMDCLPCHQKQRRSSPVLDYP